MNTTTGAKMDLTKELKKNFESFKTKAPEEVQKVMQKAHDELVNQKIAAESLDVGDSFPSFELSNQKGVHRKFSDLMGDKSHLVVSFYRGGWCPYCNLELKALQDHRQQFSELGAELVAVSPEKPDHSLSTSEKNNLEFDVLFDKDCRVASELGISFELPDSLKPIYEKFGIDVPDHNGENNFTLPVPATYIVNKQQEIVYAFKDLDYKVRLDPKEIVQKLKSLQVN